MGGLRGEVDSHKMHKNHKKTEVMGDREGCLTVRL